MYDPPLDSAIGSSDPDTQHSSEEAPFGEDELAELLGEDIPAATSLLDSIGSPDRHPSTSQGRHHESDGVTGSSVVETDM